MWSFFRLSLCSRHTQRLHNFFSEVNKAFPERENLLISFHPGFVFSFKLC